MPLGLGNPFTSSDNHNKPVLFGRMGFFDDDFEREELYSSPASVNPDKSSFKIPDTITDAFADAPKFFLDPTKDLSKETYGAVSELFKDIFSRGSIDFQKPKDPVQEKKNQEAAFKRNFYQNLEPTRKDSERSNMDRVMEEAARLMVQAMPTEEKNKTLKLNLDLDKKYTNNPYHIHTLRRMKLEELKKMQKDKQSQEMQSGKKGGLLSNMNAHEGQSMTSSSGAIMSAG